MFEKSLIMGLYSVTPVHAGSGAELSVIDLPIQRERHTGFPIIWGQSLKGVLRGTFRRLEFNGQIEDWDWRKKAREIYEDKAESYIRDVESHKRDSPLTEIIFGPSTEAASEHAGAISVGDAKVLLFPVRSLKGVFAYVTCPMVLERLKRDLELVNSRENFEVVRPREHEAIVSNNTALAVDGNVVIEEVALKVRNDLSSLMGVINTISPVKIDENRVAVVHDNVFSSLVQIATEIVARVRIKAETGTVESGALWYEEYLPSDTLLYSVVAVAKPKKEVNRLSTADDIIKELKVFDGKFVQVGGNETVGKGFVRLKVMNHEKS